MPLTGTLGEYYLKQHLGIPPRIGGWPDAIRYLPNQQSIVVIAPADDGSAQTVWRLPLAEDSSATGPAETIGVLAGATTRLPGSADGPLLLAVGVEVGLAVWASTEHETWIGLGGFDGIIPPTGRLLVIAADDHPPRHKAGVGVPAKRLHKAVRTFRRAGASVAVATPLSPRLRNGFTFADVILQHGPAGVAERIDAAITPFRAAIDRVLVHEAQDVVATHIRAITAELDSASARMIEQRKANRQAKRKAKKHRARYEAALAAISGTDDRVETFAAVASVGMDTPALVEPAEPEPFVKAIGVDVGVGKSSATRTEFAELLVKMCARRDKRTVAFAVPDHALGEQQRLLWADLIKEQGFNLTVEVWRSRKAPDPTHPDFLNNRIPKDQKATM